MKDTLREYQKTFQEILDQFELDAALRYCMELLEKGLVTIPELYENILAVSLNGITMTRSDEPHEIWKEHVKTAIVRSVIENARPHVLNQKVGADTKKSVMVVCPEEEYHDLGARMGVDFFTMAGFRTTYIGSNTPTKSIMDAIAFLKPDVVVLSVSNYLHLVALKKITQQIRSITTHMTIAVAGSAFAHTGTSAAEFGSDTILCSYEDVLALREVVS